MISKKELMIRICQLEADVDMIIDQIENKTKKKASKKVKKNDK